MVRTCRHNSWNFAMVRWTDNIYLDKIWQSIIIRINTTFYINNFPNSIVCRKGCQTLAIEVVVIIVLRDKTVANQLIDQGISFFSACVKELIEIVNQISVYNWECCFFMKSKTIFKVCQVTETKQLKGNSIEDFCS